jgi:hypothetical protein
MKAQGSALEFRYGLPLANAETDSIMTGPSGKLLHQLSELADT